MLITQTHKINWQQFGYLVPELDAELPDWAEPVLVGTPLTFDHRWWQQHFLKWTSSSSRSYSVKSCHTPYIAGDPNGGALVRADWAKLNYHLGTPDFRTAIVPFGYVPVAYHDMLSMQTDLYFVDGTQSWEPLKALKSVTAYADARLVCRPIAVAQGQAIVQGIAIAAKAAGWAAH